MQVIVTAGDSYWLLSISTIDCNIYYSRITHKARLRLYISNNIHEIYKKCRPTIATIDCMPRYKHWSRNIDL